MVRPRAADSPGVTTLEASADASDDMGQAGMVDIESAYQEAMTRLSSIAHMWMQASRETLGLSPQPTAAPNADSGPVSQAA